MKRKVKHFLLDKKRQVVCARDFLDNFSCWKLFDDQGRNAKQICCWKITSNFIAYPKAGSTKHFLKVWSTSQKQFFHLKKPITEKTGAITNKYLQSEIHLLLYYLLRYRNLVLCRALYLHSSVSYLKYLVYLFRGVTLDSITLNGNVL